MRILSVEESNLTAAGLFDSPAYYIHEAQYLARLSPEQRDSYIRTRTFSMGTLVGAVLGAGTTYGLISCITVSPLLLGTGALIGAASGGYGAYCGLNYLIGDLSIS